MSKKKVEEVTEQVEQVEVKTEEVEAKDEVVEVNYTEQLKSLESKNKTLESKFKKLQKELKEKEAEFASYKEEAETKLNQFHVQVNRKDVELKLAKNNLSEFEELFANIDSDKVDEQIEKFKELMKQKQIDASFKPNAYKADDAYATAKQRGDLKSMLKMKFFNN